MLKCYVSHVWSLCRPRNGVSNERAHVWSLCSTSRSDVWSAKFNHWGHRSLMNEIVTFMYIINSGLRLLVLLNVDFRIALYRQTQSLWLFVEQTKTCNCIKYVEGGVMWIRDVWSERPSLSVAVYFKLHLTVVNMLNDILVNLWIIVIRPIWYEHGC